MTEWIKAGVCGDLNHEAQKCKGRIIKLYASKKEDFFLTAVEDGNHTGGSFHYIGDAFDFSYSDKIFEKEIREAAGPGFDCVFHETHVHIEWDPK
jgi:hypothetical protein